MELQSIEIRLCNITETLVQRDGEEEAAAIIVFPKLISYKLQGVRNLASFRIEWPSIREIKRYHFPKLKTFGSNIQSQEPELGSTSELDPPVFFARCLHCIPRGKNYGPKVMSNRDTTNKS